MQEQAEETMARNRVREREAEERQARSGVDHLFVKTTRPDVGADDQDLVDAEAQGMSHAAIARATGLTLAMVPVRLRRAKKRGVRPSLDVAKPEATPMATAPDQEETMVEAMKVEEHEEVVIEAEREDAQEEAGDPWEKRTDLARRHRITSKTVAYRYERGLPIDGRAIDRRPAQTLTHSQQKWEWRLGARVEDAPEVEPEAIAQPPAEESAPSAATATTPAESATPPESAIAITVTLPDGVFEQMNEDLAATRANVEGMGRDLEDLRDELEAKTRELGETRKRLADARGFIDSQRAALEKADAVTEQLAQERDEFRLQLATEGTVLWLDLDRWGALQRLAGMLDTLERAADGGAGRAAKVMVETLDAVLEGGGA